MWHCGGRSRPEAWRESSLGLLVTFSQKKGRITKRWLSLGQDEEHEETLRQSSADWLAGCLVGWVAVCELGRRICNQPRRRSDLQLDVVLQTNPQQHSLDSCSSSFRLRADRRRWTAKRRLLEINYTRYSWRYYCNTKYYSSVQY